MEVPPWLCCVHAAGPASLKAPGREKSGRPSSVSFYAFVASFLSRKETCVILKAVSPAAQSQIPSLFHCAVRIFRLFLVLDLAST